jgi:hypothetical protein
VRPATRFVPLAVTAVVALLAFCAGDVAAAWRAPVDGPLARGFDLGRDPFESGRHRGVDLMARAGVVVRAPCSGPVVVAGRVGTSGGVVTLLCGPWRVTQMPLATISVRQGTAATRGTLLGTLAASDAHAGLHLGVRRDGVRFGYVDPLRFLGGKRPAPPVPVGRRGPRAPGRRPLRGPAPRAAPLRGATPAIVPLPRPDRVTAPIPGAVPVGSNPLRPGGVAPWSAWVGLALVLAGAGVHRRRTARARRARAPAGAQAAKFNP